MATSRNRPRAGSGKPSDRRPKGRSGPAGAKNEKTVLPQAWLGDGMERQMVISLYLSSVRNGGGEMTTYSARVRCSGQLHAISITGRGAVILHAHNLKSERTMVALGGEPCRCLQVLEAWRARDRKSLPEGLRPALDATTRREKKKRVDPLSLPLRDRLTKKMQEIARSNILSANYRRSQSTWAGGDHVVLVYPDRGILPASISGGSDRVWSNNGKWSGNNSYIHATLSPLWLIRVYKRGLAVVDGSFVLDIITQDDKGITVLAGKQGRGFEVNPAQARVIFDGDTPRLRWVK